MTKKFIAGGCSFTFGHELSDDDRGKSPSKMTWAYKLKQQDHEYICVASPGSGNSGIARRVFDAVTSHSNIGFVVVMWSFLSRYDWAMPRHKDLEKTRWASISPWDTDKGHEEAYGHIAESSDQVEQWKRRGVMYEQTGVRSFANSVYKYAANQYHETYLSWKSIIWLQNILEKKKIPFMFTLANNELFYDHLQHHGDKDGFMGALSKEIDLEKWFSFGERMMGFDQWALLNDYARGTTHPLDQAHQDAVKLMLPTFNKLIGEK